MWHTHAVIGINTVWVLLPVLPANHLVADPSVNIGFLAGCAVLGALLPDLDAAESKIKHLKLLGTQFKPFLLPSQVVHRSDQHRGLLHSLSGLCMVAGLSTPLIWWVGWAPVGALLLGYASHLMADSATKSGIRLLYPRPRRFYLLPRSWRITTGSEVEEAVFVIIANFALALLLH